MSTDDTPQPPPMSPADADQIRPTRSAAWALTALVSLVASLMLFVYTVSALLSAAMSTLVTYSATTTGTVTGLSRVNDDIPEHAECGPEYDFTVNGTTYSAPSPNVHETYCRFDVGDPIDLTYDPADPAGENAPAAHYTAGPVSFQATGAAAGGLFVLSIVSFVIWLTRKKR